MPKAGDLDWSDLCSKKEEYKHTPSALWLNNPSVGVSSKTHAEPILKKGEVPVKPSNEVIAKYILSGFSDQKGQWRDADYLHKEVISEAQASKLQKDWANNINDFYKAANTPINSKNKDVEWASGKSFNSTLTEEEKYRRNMYTGDSE